MKATSLVLSVVALFILMAPIRSDAQAAEFGFILASDIANQDKLPDWRAGDQFHRR